MTGAQLSALREAAKLVRVELEEGFEPFGSLREAAEHARNVVSLEKPPPIGAVTWIDYGDVSSAAWRVVLETTDDEVAQLD